MNYFYLTNQIHASSPKQRERIFEEIQKKPIGDKYYCRYYSCERKGDCDIEFDVDMCGGITNEVSELCDLPQQYTDVTVEARLFVECCGIRAHRVFKKDYWEETRTIDDAIDDWAFFSEFSPEMLELETFRKVYDNHGNLISEENKKEPYPIEELPDDIRIGYEKWKEDPVKWEENKKREEERLEEEYRLKHPANNDDDDLPF